MKPTEEAQQPEAYRLIHGVPVFGVNVDPQTRCAHYHSDIDVIAIKFTCCGKYYPCYECHEAVADHKAKQWSVNDAAIKAILCGCCGTELTIAEYLSCNAVCPSCHSQFNPGCKHHYHLYFELA